MQTCILCIMMTDLQVLQVFLAHQKCELTLELGNISILYETRYHFKFWLLKYCDGMRYVFPWFQRHVFNYCYYYFQHTLSLLAWMLTGSSRDALWSSMSENSMGKMLCTVGEILWRKEVPLNPQCICIEV